MRGFPAPGRHFRGGRPARQGRRRGADNPPPFPLPKEVIPRPPRGPPSRSAPSPRFSQEAPAHEAHPPAAGLAPARPPPARRPVPARGPAARVPPLAADSISQVLNNTTLWIIGILAGLATLMLTLGGRPVPARQRRPRRGREGQDRPEVRRDRLRPGDPRPGHRDRPEVPGRRMRLPRAPGPARPRRGPGRRRAAVLAVAVVVLAVLAVLAVAAAAGRPAAAAAPARPAAAVTLARATLTAETVPAATAAPARPGTPAAGAISLPGLGGCGLLDFGCDVSNAITSWFAGLVKSAVNPLLSLIGRTALSTPQPGSIAAVQSLVVDRARDRRRLLRAAGAHRRDHRDEPRDAADLLLGQGDRAPDRDRVRHREPVDGPDVEGDRPRQRPVRRVHRRRGEPAERRHRR